MKALKVFYQSPASIAVQGNAYGYGRVFLSLLKHLKDDERIDLVESSDLADLKIVSSQPQEIHDCFPWVHEDRLYGREVLYTTWETTALPKGWAEAINGYTAAFSTSQWCCDILKKNKVTIPVHNVPHGIDPEKFPYVERNWDDRLIFFWQGMHMLDRKGGYYVEKAFKEAFQYMPNSGLVMKIYPMVSPIGPQMQDSEFPILKIRQFLDDEAYLGLLKQAHAFIFPSRGEAFGLMPLEYAATGMISAATGWGGMNEYLDEKYFEIIDYDLSKKGEDFFSTQKYINFKPQPGVDAIPDVNSIKGLMIDIYENRDKFREKALQAAGYIQEKWTWKNAADIFIKSCLKVVDSSRYR